jgi:hypothetical protein
VNGWMVSRPTLELTQPPIQRVPVLKWPRHATDQPRLRIHSTLLCSLPRKYSWCFNESTQGQLYLYLAKDHNQIQFHVHVYFPEDHNDSLWGYDATESGKRVQMFPQNILHSSLGLNT